MEKLENYSDDFKFLTDVKSFVIQYCSKRDRKAETEDSVKCGAINDRLADDRNIRIVFPHGTEILEPYLDEKNLYFVGFIGNSRPWETVESILKDKLWEIDSVLIQELKRYPEILGYFSAERTKDGQWGNLVLFNSLDAVSEWRHSAVHSRAINEISPKYYTDIRIHGGQLLHGLDSEFDTDRTIFIDYTDETNTVRVLRKWKDNEDNNKKNHQGAS